ncbi:hypothetical protein ACFY5C_31805 [Streptomyces sp. NPDC012935]|uniref:hypothetical protein n=1 Tax=Streptomyces sp. NPDC012935 TaxID=3364857 RepID=UPI003682495C
MTLAHNAPLRVALFGLPGAGKSTTVSLLTPALEDAGLKVAVVRLAEPLYDVQHAFYERLGTDLAPGQQDGALLNFLGSHFRRIDPGFLVADFARRCDSPALAEIDVLLCDDARPADLDGLSTREFQLIRVSAPESLRRARKAHRGDKTAGQDDHSTELGGEAVVPDFQLVNDGSLEHLEEQVTALGKVLVDQRNDAAAPSSDRK